MLFCSWGGQGGWGCRFGPCCLHAPPPMADMWELSEDTQLWELWYLSMPGLPYSEAFCSPGPSVHLGAGSPGPCVQALDLGTSRLGRPHLPGIFL